MAPPTFSQVVFSLIWLAIIILTVRFVLRMFLGVRKLERRCQTQERLLAAFARELNLELPAVEPAPRSAVATLIARLIPARGMRR